MTTNHLPEENGLSARNSSLGQIGSGVDDEWSNVLLVEQPEPTLSYRTGWVVYEESFITRTVRRAWMERGWVRQLLRWSDQPGRIPNAPGLLAGDRRPALGLRLGMGGC